MIRAAGACGTELKSGLKCRDQVTTQAPNKRSQRRNDNIKEGFRHGDFLENKPTASGK